MTRGYHIGPFPVRIAKVILPPDSVSDIRQNLLGPIRRLMCPRDADCLQDGCMLPDINVNFRLSFAGDLTQGDELIIALQHCPLRSDRCNQLSAIVTVTIGNNGQRIPVFYAELKMDATLCDLRSLLDH